MEEAFSVGKNKKSLLKILACLASAVLMALAWPAASRAAQEKPLAPLPSRISPKAKDLLNHAIKALGGSAFLHFKNISTSGNVYFFYNGQMTDLAPYKSVYEPPDKRHFSYGKGDSIILVNNGDQNWEWAHHGMDSQTTKQLERWRLQKEFGIDNLFRSIIRQNGVLILDHGVDFVSNRTAYVIEIFDAQNDRIKLYLRKSNYLPIRVDYRLENPVSHYRDYYVVNYSDYQQFDGIMTPMDVVTVRNGYRFGAFYRNSAKYNVNVPANYFEAPH